MSYYKEKTVDASRYYDLSSMYNYGEKQSRTAKSFDNKALSSFKQYIQQSQLNNEKNYNTSFGTRQQTGQQNQNILPTFLKLIIGIVGTTALAIGADFLLCKGKHTKNIIKKIKADANNIKSETKVNKNDITPKNIDDAKTIPAKNNPSQVPIETAKTPEYLKGRQAENLKQYSSLEDAINDYKLMVNKGKFEAGENYESLLDTLKKHNYGNDNSFIEICSRSKNADFTRVVIDTNEHKLYKSTRMTPIKSKDIKSEFVPPDFAGSYLVKTLTDGRRFVGISVNAGRQDSVNRPIRTMINIISKDKDFTPLQKDLLEVISARSKSTSMNRNTTDILSLGVIGNNSSGGAFKINEEILLSSILTAKKQSGNIDTNFVQKALNGETLEHIVH